MNLLVFQRDFDLVDDVAEFVHAEDGVIDFSFVQIDFNQVVDVPDFVLGVFVALHFEDGHDLFD